MPKTQASNNNSANRERAEREEKIGDLSGKIVSMDPTLNKEGGKKCSIEFPAPVGETVVYISGRAIKRKKLKVGSEVECSAFRLEDGSIEFSMKSIDERDVRAAIAAAAAAARRS